ncbi:DUF4148 domain-containing protein [Burkholderia pseudomultivorans]|uniref:DUF4148 domain-containing protein n=1 Tax=Burkholderia cepacia complex TaxID=87882 RepID=UPI000CFE36D5|nr:MULTISPECIES: DUF4148 domain-containing protein [Burkholderia cepacia complex]MBR8142730.1 DUF4148 domain-containing protein [Burkholderia vietnamiensis]MBU9565001.1 DUF4148 domain-containing protein [Burkholderia multivorans]MCO8623733.1 DUF4148 domain-containing protein [Burkholderia multivorans]MDN8002814.1 DUF4148 domain-containing protein [Burkholderia multivorans]MDS0793203.1 DUF4148 domain-containing protein [Burkholderia pseudomultivorans]
MNLRITIAIVIAASAATSAFADGGHDYPNVAQHNSPVSNTTVEPAPAVSQLGNMRSEGKTREQVRRELIQAYHDGLLPTSKHDYPPSPATVARNKELHNLIEPKWAAQQ